MGLQLRVSSQYIALNRRRKNTPRLTAITMWRRGAHQTRRRRHDTICPVSAAGAVHVARTPPCPQTLARAYDMHMTARNTK